MIIKSYGNLPLYSGRTEIILSTDDIINHSYEGKGNEKDEYRLVRTKTELNSGTTSQYYNNLYVKKQSL